METKPTPGPWYIKTRQARFDPTIVIEDGVCGPDGEQIKICGVTLTSSAEAKANSRLISAVHDLLEALKWYVENDDTNIGMEGNEFWEEGLERGKAAIAKATGG
jgi:hypothetical protein